MLKIEFEFTGNVGSGKVNVFVAKKLFFHLDKFFLGGIDLSENERDLFGDEGEVVLGVEKGVVGVVLRGGSEGIEGKEIGGDDTEDHHNFDCGGTKGGSFESGSAITYFEGNRTHVVV